MTSIPAAGDARVLWLSLVQRLMARVAHDVKDALNGVTVNLEVIRSRTQREGTPASAVAPFADAAGQQLERLTTLLEALLAVARPERDPVDVAVALRRVVTLCSASASAGGTISVEGDRVEDTTTSVPGDVVRLALVAPLLETVSAGSDPTPPVRCVLTVEQGVVRVTMHAAGRRMQMPASVAEAVRDAGVSWMNGEQESGALSLAFPRA